jgi:hypothetical protein
MYQNVEKIYQITPKLPNGHKICPMAFKYYKYMYTNEYQQNIYQQFPFQDPPK